MWQSSTVRFSVDHPTAAGHFPGNPIIPGAVLLDEVLDVVRAAEDSAGPPTIRSAKFLQPVRPGDAVLVRWEPGSGGQTKFECRLLNPDRLALTGTIQLTAVTR